MEITYDIYLYNGKHSKRLFNKISGKELKKYKSSWGKEVCFNNGEKLKIYQTKNGGKVLYEDINMNAADVVDNCLRDMDFHYHVDTDCETERDCERYGCDSICRCSRIVSSRITNVPKDISIIILQRLQKPLSIIKTVINKQVLDYCTERLIRQSINSTEQFYVSTCGGYYGEEIDKVCLESDRGLGNKIAELYGKQSDIDAVKYVLENEYGYLTEFVGNCRYVSILEIQVSNLTKGNEEHYRKLNRELTDYYKEWKMPIGIYRKCGDWFKVIDGYHRLCAIKDRKKVPIIWIS